MPRYFVSLLCMTLLSGCVSATLEPAQRAAIRSIAVVPLIEDQVEVFDMRLLNPERTEGKFTDDRGWSFDAPAREIVAMEARTRLPRATIVRLPVDERALAREVYSLAILGPPAATSKIARPLREAAASAGADSIIVIKRTRTEQEFERPTLRVSGNLTAPAITAARIGLVVEVIDAASQTILAERRTQLCGTDFYVSLAQAGPFFRTGYLTSLSDDQRRLAQRHFQDSMTLTSLSMMDVLGPRPPDGPPLMVDMARVASLARPCPQT